MKRVVIGMVAAMGLLSGCAVGAGRWKLDIGRDTTRVEGPVLADGTVDYLAAYENAASAGVTDANNAGVLVRQLRGRKADAAGEYEDWQKYGTRMKWDTGAEAEAWKRLYHEKLETTYDRTEREPWKAEEFPLLAKWLASQEKALELLTEASRRERYYIALESDPTVPAPWGKARPGLPMDLGRMRVLSNALVMRAMLRAGSADGEGALEDLRSVRRLGRLLGQEPALLSQLVAIAVEQMSWRAMATLSQRDVFTAAQRAELAKEARETEELRLSPAAIDVGERFFQLDIVMNAVRGNAEESVSHVAGVDWDYLANTEKRPKLALGDLATTDWNVVLRRINRDTDELAAIARDRDEVKQAQRVTAFVAAHKSANDAGVVNAMTMETLVSPNDEAAKKKHQATVEAYLRRGPKESRAAYSDRIGLLFSGDYTSWERMFAVATRSCVAPRQLQIVLALRSFRDAKGAYPERLEDLAAAYLARLPRDPFSGQVMKYRREGSGYVLYSVGMDGKDDGGKGGDDIVSKTEK